MVTDDHHLAFGILGLYFWFLLIVTVKGVSLFILIFDALFLDFGLVVKDRKTRLTCKMHFFQLIFWVKVLCFGWCTCLFWGLFFNFGIAYNMIRG